MCHTELCICVEEIREGAAWSCVEERVFCCACQVDFYISQQKAGEVFILFLCIDTVCFEVDVIFLLCPFNLNFVKLGSVHFALATK